MSDAPRANALLRATAVGWLLVYLPVYATTYGIGQFLQLCNVGVGLTCAGILLNSRILIGMAALLSPVLAALWYLDLLAVSMLGQFLHGGTRYLFDETIPSLARGLSFYHAALPMVHALLLTRMGYDSRALPIMMGATLLLMVISMILPGLPDNLNYVEHWPNGRQVLDWQGLDRHGLLSTWGHTIVSWLMLVTIVLVPAHHLWRWRHAESPEIAA